jgi:Na+/melibiose symporter-like transporter
MPWRQGLRYGLLGLPLAFVALPLYVLLPNYYARNFAVPLAGLGLLLLAARLCDALIDPLLGRWADALFARSNAAVLGWGALAALLLAGSFAALFFPPASDLPFLWFWAGGCLMLCYAAFSALTILHQSWGALLGGDALVRSRIVAWREGLGLAGVVLASVSPVAFGLPVTVALLWLALALGWVAWSRAPRPIHSVPELVARTAPAFGWALFAPWAVPEFRALLAVFMLNGIATALPATLLLFFVQDRLHAPAEMEPWFLGTYFVAAALALAPCLRAVRRWGLERTWLAGMLLAVAVFAFAAQLGAGDSLAFLLVCALSGAAMAADLALPGALLAGVIARQTGPAPASGSYFGWWNLASKLNLALAAGLALPFLSAFGYAPGSRSAEGLQALTWAYCLLPCALKLLAAGLLYLLLLRRS